MKTKSFSLSMAVLAILVFTFVPSQTSGATWDISISMSHMFFANDGDTHGTGQGEHFAKTPAGTSVDFGSHYDFTHSLQSGHYDVSGVSYSIDGQSLGHNYYFEVWDEGDCTGWWCWGEQHDQLIWKGYVTTHNVMEGELRSGAHSSGTVTLYVNGIARASITTISSAGNWAPNNCYPTSCPNFYYYNQVTFEISISVS